MSLRLRDEKIIPTVKLQILLYPVVQSVHFDLPSYKENQYDTLLPRDIMVAMWLCYAQGYLFSCRSISKIIFLNQWRIHITGRKDVRPSFVHFFSVSCSFLEKKLLNNRLAPPLWLAYPLKKPVSATGNF